MESTQRRQPNSPHNCKPNRNRKIEPKCNLMHMENDFQPTRKINVVVPQCTTVSKIPIEMRMAIKFNRIDHLKSFVKPRPAKRISSFALWNDWPLDKSIPDYRSQAWPAGSLYFTRGKLCQSLYEPGTEFVLDDPNGHCNPLLMPDYTALHDPYAQQYFRSPSVLRQLRRNNFINEKNEVICDAKNYNQFRKYLASLQSEMVEDELKQSDELYNITMQTQKASQSHMTELRISNPTDKLAETRKMQEDVRFRLMMKTEKNIEHWEERINSIKKRRILERFRSGQQQMALDDQRRLFLNQRRFDSVNKRKALFVNIMKHEVERQQQMSSSLSQQRKEQNESTKFLALQVRDKETFEFIENMADNRVRLKERWIKHYEKNITFMEQNQGKVHAMRAAKEERINWLRRKYFDLWRAFVIKHRERPNSAHNSSWNIERNMKNTINFLGEVSGYDPNSVSFFGHLLNKDWVHEQKKHVVKNRSSKTRTLKDDDEIEEDE